MSTLLENYQTDVFFDETIAPGGEVRPSYQELLHRMDFLGIDEILSRQYAAERALLSLGITFNVYDHDDGLEKIFPFDTIPRVIGEEEWSFIDRGLQQRVRALNLFLQDIYGDQKILKDRVIPREIIESSGGYSKELQGLTPPRGVWTHVSGIDLIRHGDGNYYVLEDNVRVPSGVSYVLGNREIMKRTLPNSFLNLGVRPVYDYPLRLRDCLHSLSERDEPVLGVLTPGIFNSAYFEHSFLAQQMGVSLVEGRDLVVENGYVMMRTTRGLQRVDVLYRRVDDVFLDPDVFRPDSLLGVKGLMEAYRKGRVALANAPGTGVADDKVVYAFVPDMIRYYLNEDAILQSVPTFLCSREKDLQHVLENLENMVVKEANGSGGYGMLVGPASTAEEREIFRAKIKAHPREFIAQPVMQLSRVPTLIDGKIEGRHVDLRPYILYGEDIYVMPGGLTRVALKKGSLVVNSSQGGGSKDTWVLGNTQTADL